MATHPLASDQPDILPDLSDVALDRLTRELAHRAESYDRNPRFPRENFDILAREGLIGLTVERRLGGAGAGFVDALRVLGAVAKGEPSTALILFMTYAFHAAPEKGRRWDRALYERLAREAVAGKGLVGTFRVEPELGTPVRGGLPATVARRSEDGWRLSGEKIYSTGSTGLDWFAVWAKTDETPVRLGLFLVRPDAEGITIEPEWDHLGMRATVSHKVIFAETPVPPALAVDLRAGGLGAAPGRRYQRLAVERAGHCHDL
jgi:alkylation response protein AidB-like acyl-CoA dehydrogenase